MYLLRTNVIKMKKNIGVTDRIIRFVLFDIIIGLSYLDFNIPPALSMVMFVVVMILLLTVIFGYSLLYQLLGISTREKPKSDAV